MFLYKNENDYVLCATRLLCKIKIHLNTPYKCPRSFDPETRWNLHFHILFCYQEVIYTKLHGKPFLSLMLRRKLNYY